MSKTLFKMISIIIALVTVVLLTFSFIAGRLFRNTLAEQTYEKNTKELNIISDSIQDMHDNVKQFAFNMMENSSYDTFLHNEFMGSLESYRVMSELSKTIQVNPYFHSVSLYSGYTGEYFSTLTSHSGEDDFFRESVENFKDTSVLSPIARVLPGDIYYTSTTVYSYFYYETDSRNRITKAINVNMNAQWICDYLNRLKGKGSKAYIIDRNTRTFIDGTTEIYNLDETDLTFIKDFSDTWNGHENYVINDLNEGQLVTYLWMKNPEWILVVTEQNYDLQNTIASIRGWIILLAAILFFMCLAAAVLASRKIYKPWQELLQKITGTLPPRPHRGKVLYDDIDVIHNTFESTSSQLEEYSQFKNSMKDLLLETYIRALLHKDEATKSKLLEKDIIEFDRILSLPMMIILFRVDCWKQVGHLFEGKVKGFLTQLSDSMVSPEYDYKSVKWIYRGRNSGEFFMIALAQEETISDNDWRERISILQERFKEKTSCTISAAVGGSAKGAVEMVKVSGKAADLLSHSILFGRQSILDSESVGKHSDKRVKYDRALENAMFDAICGGGIQDAQKVLEEILERYRQEDVNTFILYLTQLFLNLDKQLEKVDKARGTQVSGLARALYHMMPEFESLDDIRGKFVEEFEDIPLENNSLEDKHNAVIDAVKEFIKEHYSEEIVLKNIAANFNLSSGYLGALFKDNVGTSVLEYTNDIRLEASAQMIQDTNLNIIDIMQRSGFINESNFYKLFKKKYGVTPKFYRTCKVAESGSDDIMP